MSEATPNEIRAILYKFARSDFETFLELGFFYLTNNGRLSRAPYLSALAAALEDVEAGLCRRLVVTVPPRYLKSITTTVLFCAWLFGRDPAVKIICASYSHDLAKRHTEDFRKVMSSDWYAKVFPTTASSILRSTDTMFITRQGGRRMASGVGGGVTGFGADYIIIDDLLKAGEAHFPEARQTARDFIDKTLLTRFDWKGEGRLVSIQQRLHEDDPVAHLLAKDGVRHFNLPAIALVNEEIPLKGGRVWSRCVGDVLDPGREPLFVLEGVRADIGERGFGAQYQQDPTPRNGDYLRWDKIQTYNERPERSEISRVVISWDIAASTGPNSSYSVGTVWGWHVDAWLLLQVERVRLEYSELLSRVRGFRRRWAPDVILIEDTSLGPAVGDELRQDIRGYNSRSNRGGRCLIQMIRPAASKEERLLAGAHLLYTGKVRFPEKADWLEDFSRELMTFPDGKFDDQVDSVSQFLDHANSTRSKIRTEGRPSLIRNSAPPRRPGFRPPQHDDIDPPTRLPEIGADVQINPPPRTRRRQGAFA